MNHIAPGAQATLDQLGQEVLDALYTEHVHRNPQADAILARFKKNEITREEYVDQVNTLFGEDHKGFVDFVMNGLTDSAKRKESIEKYLLARSMVDAPHI